MSQKNDLVLFFAAGTAYTPVGTHYGCGIFLKRFIIVTSSALFLLIAHPGTPRQ